ncbi:hypothetical protein [Amycolatopsis palatopharyngis]|uniref:hypothetical protein n=1 Tax=Amycolatopsis palatopharyngis TaxID=187982 RepID=UPI000E26409F|nr:hypothetical protein [Amycolatopsis palatopharyngis]
MNDWLLYDYDAFRAETAYRAEEIRRTHRMARIVSSLGAKASRKNRSGRRKTSATAGAVVARQRAGEHEETGSVRPDRAA